MTITLTNAKVRDLLAAHNQLDGYYEVVEQNGQKTTVRKPYIFSGKTIYNITKNINILRKLVEEANKSRDDLLSRLSNGTNEIEADKDPETFKLFAKGAGEIEEMEVEVKGLLLLKMADIIGDDLEADETKKKDQKKTVNPVPQTALASLAPVLDVFQESEPSDT